MSQEYNLNKCHARLISNVNKQCGRWKPKHCDFCKTHEKIWKTRGVKTILHDKYTFVKYIFRPSDSIYSNNKICSLQKTFRGYIVRKNINIRGICVYARHNCNNTEDCYELQDISGIEHNNFISYRDSENLFWGFHINTFYNIISYNQNNPYNTKLIPDLIKKNFKKLNYLNSQKKIIAHTKSSALQQRCIDIFQKIDNLDNYTKCEWFLNLERHHLKNMYFYLFDMWNYRLGLNINEKKKYINNIPLFNISYEVLKKCNNYFKIANITLDVFDKLLTEGKTKSDKATSANWILSVITLVNQDARNAYPWLYQAAYPN